MNLAIGSDNVGVGAEGILGETLVPTRDANGEYIMNGIESIRGTQEEYRVEGPLGVDFAMNKSH
ncbi:unnamed protein product [Ectocarpus sp. 6 AP-2014]